MIDHDVQWVAPPPGRPGGVDQGLQTWRAQECHISQIDHQGRAVGELVKPGGDRCPEPADGEHIDLPGNRHHQRLASGLHHPAGMDPHHLLGGRTPTSAEIRIGITNTWLVHPGTISGRCAARQARHPPRRSPVSGTFGQRDGVASRGLAAKWVVQWGAGPVDDLGWDEVDVAVANEDFPAGVVHVPMVRFT